MMGDGVNRPLEFLGLKKRGVFVEPHGCLWAIRIISLNLHQEYPACVYRIGSRKCHAYLSAIVQRGPNLAL